MVGIRANLRNLKNNPRWLCQFSRRSSDSLDKSTRAWCQRIRDKRVVAFARLTRKLSLKVADPKVAFKSSKSYRCFLPLVERKVCWFAFGFLFFCGLPYVLALIMASNSLVTVMQGRWDDSTLAQKKIPASTSTRCCQARRHVIHQLAHDL
jgi:hypothetical protein